MFCSVVFGFGWEIFLWAISEESWNPHTPVKWNDPAGQQNKIWASRSSKLKPPFACQPNCLHNPVHTDFCTNDLYNSKRICFHLHLSNSPSTKPDTFLLSVFIFHCQCFLELWVFRIYNALLLVLNWTNFISGLETEGKHQWS